MKKAKRATEPTVGLTVRIDPQVKQMVEGFAEADGDSMNKFVCDVLKAYCATRTLQIIAKRKPKLVMKSGKK